MSNVSGRKIKDKNKWDGDIEITVTGLRPGEKLYEEFYTSEDEVNFELYESIGVVTNSLKPSFSEIEVTIQEIETLFKRESYNKEDIIKIMNKILPNFNHIETGKTLDQKM